MARNKLVLGAVSLCLLAGCSGKVTDYTLFDLIAPRKTAFKAPANLPPADYDGEFWVDTKGCVFIRTGQNEWLPQVDFDRKPICDPEKAGEAIEPSQTSSFDTTPRVMIDPETGFRTEVLAPVTVPASYVQVGGFTDSDSADAARAKFTSLGYPILRGGTATRSGKVSDFVLGPFTVKSALDDALEVVTGLGFPDAFAYQGR